MLELYMSPAFSPERAHVDKAMTGEDILMNFVASEYSIVTGEPSSTVLCQVSNIEKRRWGKNQGLAVETDDAWLGPFDVYNDLHVKRSKRIRSLYEQHSKKRSDCVKKFVNRFGWVSSRVMSSRELVKERMKLAASRTNTLIGSNQRSEP